MGNIVCPISIASGTLLACNSNCKLNDNGMCLIEKFLKANLNVKDE